MKLPDLAIKGNVTLRNERGTICTRGHRQRSVAGGVIDSAWMAADISVSKNLRGRNPGGSPYRERKHRGKKVSGTVTHPRTLRGGTH